MASNLDQNGLSIGAFNQPNQSGAFPSVTPSGSRPADKIQRAQQTMNTVDVLHYPSDFPKFYTMFNIYQYSRNSLLSVATSELLRQVALPFPDRMLDDNKVKYDQVKFQSLIGNLANQNFKQIQALAKNPSVSGGMDLAKSFAKSLGTKETVGGLLVDAGVAALGETGQAIAGAAGYAPNYFLTVVLDGPQYKSYNMTWTMSPRNPQEMTNLTQILRVFKDAMSPGLSLDGALFNFPRVFQVGYAPNPGHLYQFRPSVLVDFAVDYSAGGLPAMRRADPGTNGWEAPAALKVSATFLELEFWLRGDFGNPDGQGSQASANAFQPLSMRGGST